MNSKLVRFYFKQIDKSKIPKMTCSQLNVPAGLSGYNMIRKWIILRFKRLPKCGICRIEYNSGEIKNEK